MLTTVELTLKKEFLTYPAKGGREAQTAYYEKVAELEAQWAEWLAFEYGDNLSADIRELVFAKAWSDGHAYGYYEVENHYQGIAEFAQKVAAASRK